MLTVSSAAAQSGSDPASEAPLHLAPLRLTPSVSLTNFGIDSNVFNEVDNPKRDFTATLSPRTEARLRLGRARVITNGGVDFVYFSQYASQRSLNLHGEARLEFPLNVFVPYVAGSSLGTRERPGNEMDARVRQSANTTTFGTDIQAGGKTSVDIAARVSQTGFDHDATFLGVDLREALSHRTRGVTITMRYNATPLTKLVVRAETLRDSFEFSPIRNADSLRVIPGVELATFALVTGRAHVGFQKFRPLDSTVPEFAGVAADVELGYTLLNATRLTVRADRDIAYSYEITEPYYVRTGLSGAVARHVRGQWEIIGNLGRQRLAYQSIRVVTTSLTNTRRIDVVSNYGTGVAYRLDRSKRVELKLDYYRRRSPVALYRDYDGFRLGTSVTYGFR